MPLTSTYLKQMKLRVMNSQEQVSSCLRAARGAQRVSAHVEGQRGRLVLFGGFLEDAFGYVQFFQAGLALMKYSKCCCMAVGRAACLEAFDCEKANSGISPVSGEELRCTWCTYCL